MGSGVDRKPSTGGVTRRFTSTQVRPLQQIRTVIDSSVAYTVVIGIAAIKEKYGRRLILRVVLYSALTMQ